MGLLDSVLGAVTHPQSGSGRDASRAEGANSTLGGLGGMLGWVAANPQLLQLATGMLSNGSTEGGLGGLMGKFQQAGLGEAMGSWIGSGANQSVSAEQMGDALGEGTVGHIAATLGVSHGEAAGQLAQLLPEIINHLTPDGQAPEGGLGGSGDLMGMLGGLLKAR